MPSRKIPDVNASLSPSFTLKTTLPRPPEVCGLLSTPTVAVKRVAGSGRRTSMRLGA